MPGCPPVRADHIGSLLRPIALRQAHRQRAAKEIDEARFQAIQDAAMRDVVRMQEACGLLVANDGEYRRGSYWSRFVEQMEGFRVGPAVFKFRDDHGCEVDFTAPYVSGKLKRVRSIAGDELEFIRANVTSAMPKITLPSAPTMQFYDEDRIFKRHF